MQYNYDFEIASLWVMTIILLHFVFIRQFPGDKTKSFGMLLFACTAECCVNILSSIGLANAAIVPQTVNEALAFAFFLLEALASYCTFRYWMAVCEYRGRAARTVGLLGSVPFGFFVVVTLLTPFQGNLYYFEAGGYYQGFLAWFGYAYIAYFYLLNILLVAARRRVVNSQMKFIMALYTFGAVGMILMQYRARDVLLTGTINALMLLLIYISMQNPNEMLDPVTGVGNERAFLSQLRNLLRHPRERVIITLHLRKFHHIHRAVGMENGNELLEQIGVYLYRLCGKFHAFHIAGDTFAVIADTAEDGRRIEGAIQARFQGSWDVRENHIGVNTNMVVQHYPGEFESILEYVEMRQFLMERARELGEQAVVRADKALVRAYQRRAKVELAVIKAIRDASFSVYYQPIYSPGEKRIVSLKALVRLQDEELGFIPPDEFIPLAERDGNIVHIGEQVLEQCCQFLSRHVLSNMSLGIGTIHINISVVQCLQQNLSETIIPVLRKYHIPPSMITLEITEHTAISTPEQIRRHMEELGELGVSFAIDDYGSGNSNCSRLIQLPFQELKLDKELVSASFVDETARIVLENEICTMQSLGIAIVVEGIEQEEQSRVMEALGVDYIQGYYYGKPMPEDECLRHIRSSNLVSENYAKGPAGEVE